MWGFYSIAYIAYLVSGNIYIMLDYTSLISLNEYKKNIKTIHKYFEAIYDRRTKPYV